WLYQFYISEKKDQVFAGLKKNQKITAENIPAATQLFTPHWIVRYLVENSLGRLWLLNRPQSRLAEGMDYYIAPEEPETDFLKITKPEEIRICDPAAGSGHMLTYAFDLLYSIYEEEGYDATEIPALILTHNLTGVEIDDRAGALAAFALAMKAAGKLGRRRFLRMEARPDICMLQPSGVTLDEVWLLWSQLPGSFDDSVADLKGNLRSLPGFTDEVETALDYAHGRLDHASSADAIMALSAQFKASLESSLAFFEELASNPKIAKAYEKISRDLWGAVVNRHSWDGVERALKEFKKGTGATVTSRRLEDIMLNLMKPAGPTDVAMNALSHFQSRLKYASGQAEKLSFYKEKIEMLLDSMQSCLQLLSDIHQFEQAKNFGSLIVPKLRDPAETLRVVEARDFADDLLLKEVQARVVAVLRMAEALSPKYHVVVANPPYAGAKGLNEHLVDFAKTAYPDSKSDLFAMFMERCLELLRPNGQMGMLNLPSWMFLSSFEKLRIKLLANAYFSSLVHCGRGLFGSDFGTVAFCMEKNSFKQEAIGVFRRLFEKHVDVRKPEVIEDLFRQNDYGRHSASTNDFQKVPGSPIVYWASPEFLACFGEQESLEEIAEPRQGMATSDVGRFLKLWFEVSNDNSMFGAESREVANASGKKWFPTNKGGGFRKWFGNNEYLVNWQDDGREVLGYAAELYGSPTRTIKNMSYYFRPSVTWGMVTSSSFSARVSPSGHLFDVGGPSAFPREDFILPIAAFLNSSVFQKIITTINPTMNFNSGDLAKAPFKSGLADDAHAIKGINAVVEAHRSDWDAYETSWDFTTLPLLQPDHHAETLEATYTTLRTHWQGMTDEMQRLEEENNRIFIDAYGLQDELPPEVPLNEITLTCNPAYRYGIKNDAAANETRLRADTMAEFLSYAVGCMFGRYSLDAPGLILANQGETLADYLARVPEPTFMPDEDNVIPVLDADWFPDDITERFRLFLRVTFGEAHFRENLRYIEDALGKDIRKYFTKDFYADHVKRYKKRPIYWMFSSPKGTFNALIYMHRYRGDTVSVLLNDYLREFITKLEGERARLDKLADDATATQGQRTKALKQVGVVAKQIDELHEWEREVIFPLAQQKIEIDLDDGVKVNYPKFGTALKKIPGLS
ncbi:BREX-1 system adenine-specific DNA-methyltransferase PglX, partial [Nisaea sp.]|uniref:BREX-1 system adenine-specific DNA-methyltransferase PglX n=1 Tax=Nisaea sp. TaxID=2024842 RepID=UPI003297ABA1